MRKKKVASQCSYSEVMRCSRHVNVGRMDVRQNCEPFKEVDCLKYLELQIAVAGECESDVGHTINNWYKTWIALCVEAKVC